MRTISVGRETRVLVGGELDLYGAQPLRGLLDEPCGRKAPAIVVDLGDVRFCDGQGLRVLLDASDRARRRGGYLRVRRPGRMLRRLVGLLQLHDRFGPGSRQRGPGARLRELKTSLAEVR